MPNARTAVTATILEDRGRRRPSRSAREVAARPIEAPAAPARRARKQQPPGDRPPMRGCAQGAHATASPPGGLARGRLLPSSAPRPSGPPGDRPGRCATGARRHPRARGPHASCTTVSAPRRGRPWAASSSSGARARAPRDAHPASLAADSRCPARPGRARAARRRGPPDQRPGTSPSSARGAEADVVATLPRTATAPGAPTARAAPGVRIEVADVGRAPPVPSTDLPAVGREPRIPASARLSPPPLGPGPDHLARRRRATRPTVHDSRPGCSTLTPRHQALEPLRRPAGSARRRLGVDDRERLAGRVTPSSTHGTRPQPRAAAGSLGAAPARTAGSRSSRPPQPQPHADRHLGGPQRRQRARARGPAGSHRSVASVVARRRR